MQAGLLFRNTRDRRQIEVRVAENVSLENTPVRVP